MVYVVSFGHRDGNCLRPRRCPRYRILKRALGGRDKLVRMRDHDADGKPETMTNPTDPGDGRIRESSKSPGSSPSRLVALALTHTHTHTQTQTHKHTHKQMHTRRHTLRHCTPLLQCRLLSSSPKTHHDPRRRIRLVSLREAGRAMIKSTPVRQPRDSVLQCPLSRHDGCMEARASI